MVKSALSKIKLNVGKRAEDMFERAKEMQLGFEQSGSACITQNTMFMNGKTRALHEHPSNVAVTTVSFSDSRFNTTGAVNISTAVSVLKNVCMYP